MDAGTIIAIVIVAIVVIALFAFISKKAKGKRTEQRRDRKSVV